MADERKATNTKTDDTKKLLEKMDSLDKKMEETKSGLKHSYYWNMITFSLTSIAIALTVLYGITNEPPNYNNILLPLIIFIIVMGLILTVLALWFMHPFNVLSKLKER